MPRNARSGRTPAMHPSTGTQGRSRVPCGLQLTCTSPEANPGLSFVQLNAKGGSFLFEPGVYESQRAEVQQVVGEWAATMIKEVEL